MFLRVLSVKCLDSKVVRLIDVDSNDIHTKMVVVAG